MRCAICGAAVERMLLRRHGETSHPDYVQWTNRLARLFIYVIASWVALTAVDALFGRFLFYVIVTYALGTSVVFIVVDQRKLRGLRAAWKETHSSP